jgi:hypothetical protein
MLQAPNILHFSPDDKFMPGQVRLFDSVLPGSSQFRVLGAEPGKFLKSEGSVRFVDQRYWEGDGLADDLAWADLIITHAFLPPMAHALVKARPETVVVWLSWGWEYYELDPGYPQRYLMPATQRLWMRLNPPAPPRTTSVPRRLGRLAKRMLRRTRTAVLGDRPPRFHEIAARWPEFIHRVDCATLPDDGYGFVRACNPAFHAKRIPFLYYSASEVLEQGPAAMSGPDILLGNSATPTNNHLEVLRILSDLDLAGRRVIVPLNYGHDGYRDAIIAEGQALLGEHFHPLTEWMPIDAYNAVTATCGVVIMAHLRQQAHGNIGNAIYKGARVLLQRDSLYFSRFKSQGAAIGTVDDLCCDPRCLHDPLTPEEIAANRRLLGALWSDARVQGYARFIAAMSANRHSVGRNEAS